MEVVSVNLRSNGSRESIKGNLFLTTLRGQSTLKKVDRTSNILLSKPVQTNRINMSLENTVSFR